MSRSGRKTVRFTQIVERCGEPRVHTLWLPPDKDPEFKRALHANRVMTVESAGASGKTDVGRIGFDPDDPKPGQFLVFPKSLQRFAGARVVGIKFDLVAQPKLAPASSPKATATSLRHKSQREPLRTSAAQKAKRPDPERQARAETPARTANENAPKIVPFESDAGAENASSTKPSKTLKPTPPTTSRRRAKPAPADRVLLREIRAAMRDLKAGKSVAAYQRLERAVGPD